MRMRQSTGRIGVFAFSLALLLRAFESGYFFFRAYAAVMPDSLLHYHWILSWWRHGDSVRGFTLTPSPYFIDFAIQIPIALLAPDFEWFSYAMSLAFAALLFGSVLAVARVVFEASLMVASLIATLTMIAFYALSPWELVGHAFSYNHTSEAVCGAHCSLCDVRVNGVCQPSTTLRTRQRVAAGLPRVSRPVPSSSRRTAFRSV